MEGLQSFSLLIFSTSGELGQTTTSIIFISILQHPSETREASHTASPWAGFTYVQLNFTLLMSAIFACEWLTALLLHHHGFSPHKGAFRDALSLRYGWTPEQLPSHCVCGQKFHLDHALSCQTGRFPTCRHNEVQDLLATLITEVCHGMATEPLLSSLTGEIFHQQTTTTDDDARLDIRARGFWGNQAENTFFDVNVLY